MTARIVFSCLAVLEAIAAIFTLTIGNLAMASGLGAAALIYVVAAARSPVRPAAKPYAQRLAEKPDAVRDAARRWILSDPRPPWESVDDLEKFVAESIRQQERSQSQNQAPPPLLTRTERDRVIERIENLRGPVKRVEPRVREDLGPDALRVLRDAAAREMNRKQCRRCGAILLSDRGSNGDVCLACNADESVNVR